jgi:phage/plasmid-like protein (TIGR03299 family)
MTAEIEEFGDGRAAFFGSTDENWWHKLGTITRRCLTAEEALQTAFLNWDVTLEPAYAMYTPEPNLDKWLPIPGTFATVRNHPILGRQAMASVGSKYTVIQNAKAFQVLNDIVGMSGATFETAGSLFNGRLVFMTMLMPDHMQYKGKDCIKSYLLARNSHDGSSNMTIAIVRVRVVCNNTLEMAMGSALTTYKVRHTESAEDRLKVAREALDLTFKAEGALAEDIDRMLNTVYTEEQFKQVLVPQLIPNAPKDAKEFIAVRQAEQQAILRGLWNRSTQDGIRGTHGARTMRPSSTPTSSLR